MADHRRVAAPTRDRRLGGIVERIQIELRQRAEQLVGPAIAGERRLQPGHPFGGAVHADMDDGIGLEAVLEPSVERRVLMMRREGLLEQQPHRVPGHAHRRLQGDRHIAELDRIEPDPVAARRRDVPRRLTPEAVDAVRRTTRQPAPEVGQRDHTTSLAFLQGTEALHEVGALRGRAVDRVTLSAQALEQRGDRRRDIEQRGGACLAEPGREVVEHERHAFLGRGLAPQADPALDLIDRALEPVRHGGELAVADRAERHRARHAVHLGQVVHHDRLHGVRAALVPLELILHQQRLRDDVRHIELAEQVRRRLVVMAGLGGGCGATDDGKTHRRQERVDRLVGQPLAHRDMRLDAGDEHRQHRHATRLETHGELAQVVETLDHMLAHAEHRDQRLTLAVAALLRRPLEIGVAVVEQRAADRIEAPHGRDHGHRRDLETCLPAGIAQDELDHLGDVRGVRLVPVEVHAEPSAEPGELLRDQGQQLRGHLHQLGICVQRILVAAAREQTHQHLDRLRCLTLLLFEPVLADFGERHDLGHALVGEHGLGARLRELRSQPVRLGTHVDQADEDDIRVEQIGGERGVGLIDMGIVVAPQAHLRAVGGEPSFHLTPGPGVEALDAHHESDRRHAPPPESSEQINNRLELTLYFVLLC